MTPLDFHHRVISLTRETGLPATSDNHFAVACVLASQMWPGVSAGYLRLQPSQAEAVRKSVEKLPRASRKDVDETPKG